MAFDIRPAKKDKSYNRRYKSPTFPFSNAGIITANAKLVFDYHRDTPATEKYNSFNNIRVSNNSSVGILLAPNQDYSRAIFIASGTTEVIDQEAVSGTVSLSIQNVGAANITAKQIRILIWKTENAQDNIISNIHQRLFKRQNEIITTGFKKLQRTI